MTDILLSTPGLSTPGRGPLTTAALRVSKLSLRSLKGVGFLASPPNSYGYQPLHSLIGMPSTGVVFIVNIQIIGESYFHRTELPTDIAISHLEERTAGELTASGHRSRELEWRQTHEEELRTFSGQWVVLEGEEIIARGRDPVQLVSEARKRGIGAPYVFFVETQTEEVVRMGL